MNKKITIPVIAVLLVLLFAGIGYKVFLGKAFGIAETTYIYVDKDDTSDSIRMKLVRDASLKSPWGYDLLCKVKPFEVHTGRYAIQPADGMITVYRKITGGNQSPLNLTIPSVRTADKLANTLGRKLMIDSLEIVSALKDSAFCAQWDYDTTTIMALFIPNTYQVYWDLSLDEFMERMQKENDKFWKSNGREQKAQAIGLSKNEVITLASIVEEETANNSEKPMVAGMYLNRLKIGMPLQADPTIKFALQDFSLRRIYHKHLSVESPYNTYKNIGLPPGPIRIPQVVTIDAVLNRVDHEYLYMCAKEDFSGTHNFAKTYEEHLRNAAKYTQALNKRNIK